VFDALRRRSAAADAGHVRRTKTAARFELAARHGLAGLADIAIARLTESRFAATDRFAAHILAAFAGQFQFAFGAVYAVEFGVGAAGFVLLSEDGWAEQTTRK